MEFEEGAGAVREVAFRLIPLAKKFVFYITVTPATVHDKSFTVRKLSQFSWIFIKPQFSLLNFCSAES